MLRHLRLAQLRGSLSAPNSLVQDRALEYLYMLDEMERQQRRSDFVKGVWIQAPEERREEVTLQFPEFFKRDPFAQAKKEDGTYDIDQVDDAAVEWESPASPEDDEALSRWIEERQYGSLTGADSI